MHGNKKWTDIFIELFSNESNESIKIVGTSINIYESDVLDDNILTQIYDKPGPFTHIQSMFFCLNKSYYEFLYNNKFFDDDLNNKKIYYIVAYKEIGLSQIALKNGWNINSILPLYKDLNYLEITNDINPTSDHGDPYYKNGYFNSTINKYDVIFFKSYRFLDDNIN